jgi:hypothetical protein
MEVFLAWMESSLLARFVLENAWVFPALETMHFLGLILLIGSIYVVDLRLLGFGRTAPLGTVLKLVPVSLVGFAINVTTGTMFQTCRSESKCSLSCSPGSMQSGSSTQCTRRLTRRARPPIRG